MKNILSRRNFVRSGALAAAAYATSTAVRKRHQTTQGPMEQPLRSI